MNVKIIKLPKDEFILNVLGYLVLALVGFISLYPFLLLIGSSFSSESVILAEGYRIIPSEISLDAYELIFRNPERILQAYGVSIFITVVGTVTALFISAMSAYVISLKKLKYRNQLTFFLYFTTLFNGGLAPYFIILSNVYHLRNTFLVLLLVPMFNVFYILILRTFIKAIPESLLESTQMEGAGEFYTFIKIILPLSKPALASIGLFTALFYWNDWWTSMMFLDEESMYPLQYVLYRILSNVNVATQMVKNIPSFELPKETLKTAMTVVSTGPILFLYLFAQKYFVKGITLGAVKG